jgi:hypothetical protein
MRLPKMASARKGASVAGKKARQAMTKADPKETVGAASSRLSSKPDENVSPIDMQREMHSEGRYEENLWEAAKRGLSQFGRRKFYLVVLFKKERLMHNVVRQYFLPRLSCPTPQYDQTVYSYDPADDQICYLWTVPDKETTKILAQGGPELPFELLELASYARDFVLGKLDRRCAELNGENWNG